MRTTIYSLIFGIVAVCLSSCNKNNEIDTSVDKPIKDPEGTVIISIVGGSGGNNFQGIFLNSAGNFYGTGNEWQFVTIGQTAGLGNVTSIPESGYSYEFSARTGYGYIGKRSLITSTTAKIEYIRFWAESAQVSGAEIRYQYPFQGKGTAIDIVSGNTITLESGVNIEDVKFKDPVPIEAKMPSNSWAQFRSSTNGAFGIWAPANTSVKERSIDITVKSGSLAEKTIKVTQNGVAPFVTPSLTNINVPSSQSNGNITISSNTSWEASSDSEWCIISPKNGVNNGSISYNIQQNTNTEGRTATITFTAQGATSTTVKISQVKLIPSLSVTSSKEITIAHNTIGSNITIQSNTAWNVKSDASWCIVGTGSGINNGTATLSIQPNTTDNIRIASVTVSAYGVDGVVIKIAQTPFFAGGAGILGNPYIINSADQLNIVRDYPSGCFRLNKDINLTTLLSTTTAGWLPICNGNNYFTGDFDGNGKTISGLWINRPAEEFVGFFGKISRAKISNLTLTLSPTGIIGEKYTGGITAIDYYHSTLSYCNVNGNITGTYSVGGIIGGDDIYSGSTGDISYCNVNGNITGTGNVGGINGKDINIISFSKVSGNIKSASNAGGISGNRSFVNKSEYNGTVSGIYCGGIAVSPSTSITKSKSSGRIEATISAGGIASSNPTSCQISDCYSTSTIVVTGSNTACYAGGVVARIDYFNSAVYVIKNCYYAGAISLTYTQGGSGVISGVSNNGNITSSYYDNTLANSTTVVDNSRGRSTTQMKQLSTFTGWDFNTIWEIKSNSYPTLR